VFKDFRQGVDVARTQGGGGRPGRSLWPEPETIRQVSEQGSPGQQRFAVPRAEFGLPIVFRSKSVDGKRGDNKGLRLLPGSGRERMASPLILKPLATSPSRAIPVILRLNTPPLEEVVLEEGDKPPLPFGAGDIRGNRLVELYPDSPLSRSPNGSALETFLLFAKERGFKEEQ